MYALAIVTETDGKIELKMYDISAKIRLALTWCTRACTSPVTLLRQVTCWLYCTKTSYYGILPYCKGAAALLAQHWWRARDYTRKIQTKIMKAQSLHAVREI